MPKFEYAKGRIPESLQFISQEMMEFEIEYESKTWKEYQKDKKVQKIMERTVENILTALIEISGSILTQEGIIVESYQDALQKCAKLFKFTEKEQQNIEKLANIRNRLAHRYLNLKWQVISMYKTHHNLIQKLLASILKREKSKERKMK